MGFNKRRDVESDVLSVGAVLAVLGSQAEFDKEQKSFKSDFKKESCNPFGFNQVMLSTGIRIADRHDNVVVAVTVEILQVGGVIHHLLHVGLKRILRSDFELQAKDDAAQKQYYVDELAEPQNVILENNIRLLVLPGKEHLLQKAYFAEPRLVGSGRRLAVVSIVNPSRHMEWISADERFEVRPVKASGCSFALPASSGL